MKKTIATSLVFTMLVASLAACSGGDSGTNNTTAQTSSAANTEKPSSESQASSEAPKTEGGDLSIAVFKGGYGDAYWQEIAKQFGTEMNVNVTVLSDPDLGNIMKPKMLSGEIPDFMYLPITDKTGFARGLVKDKMLADITDVFTDDLKSKFIPGFLENSATQPYDDGKIYLAPIYYSALGLFYNKTLFEEANLTVPETWDDFFALGDEVKGKEILGKQRSIFTYQGANPGYMEGLIIPAIASTAGADAMDNCFNYVEGAWKNPDVIKTLDTIAKIGLDGYMIDGTTALDFTAAQTAVKTGDALFIPCGNWLPQEMANIEGEKVNDKDFEWGFAATPVFSDSKGKYLKSALEEMYIPKDAKNIELGKKFLAYQYTEDAMKLNGELNKGLPPILGAADLVKDSLDPSTYDAFKIYDNGYTPYMGDFASVDSNVIPREEFYNNIAGVMRGETTVEEWTNKLEDVSNKVRDKIVK